jgi:hypothetical protein
MSDFAKINTVYGSYFNENRSSSWNGSSVVFTKKCKYRNFYDCNSITI